MRQTSQNGRLRWPMQIGFVAVFAGWFVLMAYLGTTRYFFDAPNFSGLAPVQQAIVFPIVLFWLTYLLTPPVRRFVRTTNLTFLVALQGVRILALSHLVSWGYGLMAGGFALPVAIGNFIVCMLALTSVSVVANREGRWRLRVLLLTIVGIAEFLMTIALASLGFFVAALPLDPPVAPNGYVSFAAAPLSLFPTYAIPALLVMHCVTLVALLHDYRTSLRRRDTR